MSVRISRRSFLAGAVAFLKSLCDGQHQRAGIGLAVVEDTDTLALQSGQARGQLRGDGARLGGGVVETDHADLLSFGRGHPGRGPPFPSGRRHYAVRSRLSGGVPWRG